MITRGPLYGFRTCLSALQGSVGVFPLVQKVMNGTDLLLYLAQNGHYYNRKLLSSSLQLNEILAGIQ